jgi:hypothetical protein
VSVDGPVRRVVSNYMNCSPISSGGHLFHAVCFFKEPCCSSCSITGNVLAPQVTGQLNNAQISADNINGGTIDITFIKILGLAQANVQSSPPSNTGMVLRCIGDTVRIGACPPPAGNGCQFTSSDASGCEYQVVGGGSCDAFTILCA